MPHLRTQHCKQRLFTTARISYWPNNKTQGAVIYIYYIFQQTFHLMYYVFLRKLIIEILIALIWRGVGGLGGLICVPSFSLTLKSSFYDGNIVEYPTLAVFEVFQI